MPPLQGRLRVGVPCKNTGFGNKRRDGWETWRQSTNAHGSESPLGFHSLPFAQCRRYGYRMLIAITSKNTG